MEKYTIARLEKQVLTEFSAAKNAYLLGDLRKTFAQLQKWWEIRMLLAQGQKLPLPEVPKHPSFYFGPENFGNGNESSPVPLKPYPVDDSSMETAH